MSRAAAGNPIPIAPRNDVYTALVIIAVVAEVIAFLLLYMGYKDAFNAAMF